MNLQLNDQEFESLIDMCTMALTVVHFSGQDGQQEFDMTTLFNKIVALKNNREEIVTDERIERLQTSFFHPYLDRFKELLDEDAQQGVDVIAQPVVAEDVEEVGEASEAEVVTNNFWGRL